MPEDKGKDRPKHEPQADQRKGDNVAPKSTRNTDNGPKGRQK